jgi:hypothetical protein
MGFRVQSVLLDRPIDQLVAEVNEYIHRHAPEGSWHKETAREDEEAAPDEEH